MEIITTEPPYHAQVWEYLPRGHILFYTHTDTKQPECRDENELTYQIEH